jgi:hypothetical protein
MVGSTMDGEAEPSLGWTGNVNQASRSRLGDGEDYEKDDADHEDSDPARNRTRGNKSPTLRRTRTRRTPHAIRTTTAG